MNYFFSLILTLFAVDSFAQNQRSDYNHFNHSLHLVEFTDKLGSPFSVFRPQEYLSARAIERREKMGIAIDEHDLPISAPYLQQVLQIGVRLHNKSRWLNTIAIRTKDSLLLQKIALLPFVKSVKPLGKWKKVRPIGPRQPPIAVNTVEHTDNYYGAALNQTRMLSGDLLHSLGFTGQDIHIAVLDGGFKNVYRMPVFDSLRNENRILGTHDFLEGDEHVYEASGHGTNALSCMAAKSPNFLVGTAPDASYYLFKTEDVKGEFRTEEMNWVAAVEYADSLGVDVINSSLGYSGFNDTTMSYSHADLDGKTAYISRGATIGAQKGLLIVASAGNEGRGKWQKIGVPADVQEVISVAAVRGDGKRAGFSSLGPTTDGRIKPDLAAQGFGIVVAEMTQYKISRISSTSFSAPVLAGTIASLKQAFPEVSAANIRTALQRSGSQASAPDTLLGYGIPNFFMAYLILSEACIVLDKDNRLFTTFATVQDQVNFIVEQKERTSIKLAISNKLGQIKARRSLILPPNKITNIIFKELEQLPSDIYTLQLNLEGTLVTFKLVKS